VPKQQSAWVVLRVYIQAMSVIVVVITVANKVPCEGWLELQEFYLLQAAPG